MGPPGSGWAAPPLLTFLLDRGGLYGTAAAQEAVVRRPGGDRGSGGSLRYEEDLSVSVWRTLITLRDLPFCIVPYRVSQIRSFCCVPSVARRLSQCAAMESDVAEPYILPELRTVRDSTEGAEPQRSLTSTGPTTPDHTPDTLVGAAIGGQRHDSVCPWGGSLTSTTN